MRMTSIILGAALLFFIASCENEQGKAISEKSSSSHITESRLQDVARTGDQVVVSRSLGFGSINAVPYGTFTKKKQIEVFTQAVQSAEKMQGRLDVSQPDYDIVIKQGRKQLEIHLWIDARYAHGMYTYVSDTGTGYKLTAESTSDLYNLIWGIRYDSKQAATNGDFVNARNKLSNLEIWEKFVTNVKVGVKDEIQVVKYTIEGGPIFDNLSFDGETIRHMYDNTHDQYGTSTKRLEFCKSIDEIKTDRGTDYKLSSCGESFVGEGMFNLLIP